MLVINLFGWMFVAARTCVITVCSDMTGLAFRFSLVTMIDWEGMLGQLGRVPAAGFVAVFTGQAKIPKVNLWFCVTIFTLRQCFLVKLINMASSAFNLDMAPIQAEDILVI